MNCAINFNDLKENEFDAENGQQFEVNSTIYIRPFGLVRSRL